MAFVIAEPCAGACHAACVDVCPVDCIHGPLPADDVRAVGEAERQQKLSGVQMYIDPDECTCCSACVSECPVSAIFDADDLPAQWAHYEELNAAFFAKRRG